MLSFDILIPAILNGIMTGAVYALIALGLTLIYGVLHIINFAHGALLTAALFAVYFAHQLLGLDPYVAVFAIAPVFFVLGYALQRFIIGPASHGEDRNILLVTLGIAVVLQNLLLYAFHADTRTIDVPSGFNVLDIGVALLPVSRVVGVGAVMVLAAALWALLNLTDIGKAIRAVSKEKLGAEPTSFIPMVGAELSGIDVAHVYATTFGLGTACVAIAACLLMPSFYVNPNVGNSFILVAFTIVVLGGMGSVPGALLGGLMIGVIESLGGLYFGESLGQLGIFVTFILVLLLRPSGLLGARA